jgi:hypothetical protein
MDGPTQTSSHFVATAGALPYDFLIHTPRRRRLSLSPGRTGRVIAATGDLLAVELPGGGLIAAYTAWHTIVGAMPRGGTITLAFEDREVGERDDVFQVTRDLEAGDAVVLTRRGERWAVAYGRTVGEAKVRAVKALNVDLSTVLAERLALYDDLPALAPEDEQLLKKCVSVMKVNTLAPEGMITTRWSTPDRVPHRHMWLWDSVFHAIGMHHVDAELAWDFLRAVLDRQRPDGMIPHCMHVDGTVSEITQPPVLAWGVWSSYRHVANRAYLAGALPRLERYLAWNLDHRDENDNGLLAWFIEGNVTCRSGESGMDNSPRFDRAVTLDAVDFSTFQALDMRAVARMAAVLGDQERAVVWRDRAERIEGQIHELLWDAAAGFYCDRAPDGTLSPVKAVSGFLPLLLPSTPEVRVDRLVAHLENPATFKTAFPVPSVAVEDPAWSTDMWRGATWINLDYLVIRGLLSHGRVAEAAALRTRLLHYVNHYYRTYGVLFEFYDAKDAVPPVACDRKGPRRAPYDIRVKMDAIRDYHWTAALTADLLLRDLERSAGKPVLDT